MSPECTTREMQPTWKPLLSQSPINQGADPRSPPFASELRCHPACSRRAITVVACVAAQAQVAVVLGRQRQSHRARLRGRVDLSPVGRTGTRPRGAIPEVAAEAAEADVVPWPGAGVTYTRWAWGRRGSSACGCCGCCGARLSSGRVSTKLQVSNYTCGKLLQCCLWGL